MNHSDWQLSRIRNALRAYHRYERSHDGTYFTWNDVQEAIHEYTGVKVLAERLRQFVEGIRVKKDGVVVGRKHPAPKDASLTAIVEFATHEDLDLLSKDELTDFSPKHQASMRLLEYLDQDFDTQRIPPPETLNGEYKVHINSMVLTSIKSLTLERGDDSGIIQVTEIEEYFDTTNDVPIGEWSDQDKKEYFHSRTKHAGWAVLTPEDNLFIFMKNESNGRNLYYFMLVVEQNIWAEESLKRLILLNQSFPLEIEEGLDSHKDKLRPVTSHLSRNLTVFDRVPCAD